MFQMGLMDVMQAEREREIASAIRTRRLLRPSDEAAEVVTVQGRATETRRLAVRAARPSGG